MITLFLLAIAPVAGNGSSAPCLPVKSALSQPIASAIEDHRALRKAIDEPMPHSPTMVMLYGKGGHLSTQEYSIIVVREANGSWQGTAVGRSQVWVKDAPYIPMKRAEWTLDKVTGHRLDDAISRRCLPGRKDTAEPAASGPPPRGYVPERIDVVTPGQVPSTFSSDEGEGKIAALIRPPQ
jgi:hypothetical protein